MAMVCPLVWRGGDVACVRCGAGSWSGASHVWSLGRVCPVTTDRVSRAVSTRRTVDLCTCVYLCVLFTCVYLSLVRCVYLCVLVVYL